MTTYMTDYGYSNLQQIIDFEGLNSGNHNDLISFLGYMQKSGLDFLPIQWQAAVQDVGRGGSARISQAAITLGTSFAFKRVFFDGTNLEQCFKRVSKEAMILRHVFLINHKNFIRLEAFCLEVVPGPDRLLPVLIFNKMPLGNLQEFLLSKSSVTFEERLGFCADILEALAALHKLHIIHGDIKPLNALVFEQDGSRIIKLADFGDSSICDNDESLACMPKSVPWDPPEHHYRGIPFLQAKMSDVYSFGLSCFWILFNNYLHLLLTDPNINGRELQSASDMPPTVATLATLRATRNIQDAAKEIVCASKCISPVQKCNLESFFDLSLGKEPIARSTDHPTLLSLLDSRRCTVTEVDPSAGPRLDHGIYSKDYERRPIHQHWAPSERQIPSQTPALGIHPNFNLAQYMLVLLHADRRFRVAIVHELSQQYGSSKCFSCRANVAFQLALSYATGYGIPRDPESSRKWLEISGKSREDLQFQIEYSRIMIVPLLMNTRLRDLQSQFFFAVDHAREYRSTPKDEILDTKATLMAEIRDIGGVYGETHNMTIALKRTLAQILNKLGMFNDAAAIQEHLLTQLKTKGETDHEMKVLADLAHTYSLQQRLHLVEYHRERVAKYYMQHLGEEHMGTLAMLTNLAHTQTELGKWGTAESTLLQVIAMTSRIVGAEHRQCLAAQSILAAVYLKQGRLIEAETLQSQILENRVKTLGANHESTCTSMANLAVILSAQGRFSEAQEIELKVVGWRESLLGEEHPDTLTSLYNLATTFGKLKSLEMEEKLLRKVLDKRKLVLSTEQQDTITTAASLAKNLHSQGQLKEAEDLVGWVIESRIRKFGKAHPLVLAGRTDLMWIIHDRGDHQRAEAVQLDNITVAKAGRGLRDQDVLRCMSALASLYKVQGRLQQSLAGYEEILQIRIEILGQTHRDTVKTAQDIEIVKHLIRRQDD